MRPDDLAGDFHRCLMGAAAFFDREQPADDEAADHLLGPYFRRSWSRNSPSTIEIRPATTVTMNAAFAQLKAATPASPTDARSITRLTVSGKSWRLVIERHSQTA